MLRSFPCKLKLRAPVAQMDRAIASGAIGREFESLRAHQILPRTSSNIFRSPDFSDPSPENAGLRISAAGSRFAKGPRSQLIAGLFIFGQQS